MKSPKLPEVRPGANAPQSPRSLAGGSPRAASPMARMFAPLTSGIFAQRAGRRSLLGGGGQ